MKPPTDCRFAAVESTRDFLCGELRIQVVPRKFLGIDRMLHHDAPAPVLRGSALFRLSSLV
jgi:hypothetical protein